MPVRGPSFIRDLGLGLRSEIVCLLAHHRKDVRLPALERRVLDEEDEHVPLRLLGELLLLRPLLLQLLALLVEEPLGVDELRHVFAVRLEPPHLDGLLGRLLARLGGEVRRVLVDEVLQRERAVDERLHRLDAHPVDDAPHAGGVVGHLVHHLAVGVLEGEVVLEEIDVPVDMGHHQLLVHVHVGLEQIGIGRIVVDDHFIDLRQPVLVSLGELLVLHPEPPVRIAVGKAAIGGHHVDLVIVQHFEDGLVEIEPELVRVLLDLLLDVAEVGRELGAAVVHLSSPSRENP